MQPKDIRKITVAVTRFLKFFLALWIISQMVFYFVNIDDPFLTVTETYITAELFGWICVGILLLAFSSFIKPAIIYEEDFRLRYLREKEAKAGKILILLGDRAFWIRAGAFVLLFYLLPLDVFPAFKLLATLYLPVGGQKLLVTLLLTVVLLGLTLLGYRGACNVWEKQDEKELTEKKYNRGFLGRTFVYIIGGLAASYLVPHILPLFVNLPKLFADPSAPAFFTGILALVGVFFAAKYARRILSRRKFVKKLVQISRENKNKLSKIEKPYASLFRPYGGESFTVQCDGKSFSCKMLCGRNVKEPLIFSEEGYMEFTFSADVLGYDLFQYKKRFEFDYSSPYKKIIIMNSMPRKVLLNWESKQIPLESGDRFGEYILYTETEFLNALNRDVLGR